MGKKYWKKLKNSKIRKKLENFKTPFKNLEKYGLFSEFRTSTEKSVMLTTLKSCDWIITGDHIAVGRTNYQVVAVFRN